MPALQITNTSLPRVPCALVGVLCLAAAALADAPPAILQHPQSTSVIHGHTVTLTVDAAFDPTLTWEWRKNRELIPGETAARFTIYNASQQDTSEYYAVASNQFGSRWSRRAVVIVLPPENEHGRVDRSLDDPAFDGPVTALAMAIPDGYFVAGAFRFSRQTAAPGLLRLQADGSPVAEFRLGKTGPHSTGSIISIAADSTALWVGGDFTSFDGTAAACLVKLNQSGLRDTGFTPALPAGVSDVQAIKLLADGRAYVAGRSLQNSVATDWVVRLMPDGTRDSTFSIPSFINGRVRAMVLRPDGRLWIGGNFFRPTGSTTHFNRLALLTSNGAAEPAFQPPTGSNSGANLEIRCLHSVTNGSVIAGGYFNRINGTTRLGLAQINVNGSLDAAFVPPAFDDAPLVLTSDTTGRFYVGGDISLAGTKSVRSLIRLTASGTLDTTWKPTPCNGPAQALVVSGNGILVGGAFDRPHAGLCRLYIDNVAPESQGTAIHLPLSESNPLFYPQQNLASTTPATLAPDQGTAEFPLTTDVTRPLERVGIWVNIQHENVQSLDLTLIPPPALGLGSIALTTGANLRSGADFTRTHFSPHTQRRLEFGVAPYTEAFLPEGNLESLAGRSPQGNWTLRITDQRLDGRRARLQNWTLEMLTAALPPSYLTWLGTQPANAVSFHSFAFGQSYHQPPQCEIFQGPWRLRHGGWPTDTLTTFRYWQSRDLQNWQPVTPAHRRLTITPSATSIEAQFATPPESKCWWRVEALR